MAIDLARPREPGDPIAAGFARKYLQAELQDRSESVQEACRQLLLALLPGGSCSAQEIARHMRVDRRTLHRRLAAEGLSFSVLLDQVRANLVESLRNGPAATHAAGTAFASALARAADAVGTRVFMPALDAADCRLSTIDEKH